MKYTYLHHEHSCSFFNFLAIPFYYKPNSLGISQHLKLFILACKTNKMHISTFKTSYYYWILCTRTH
uniref:Uncharacterized protein n=1 Tax=Rhizophora mucronata TaxID=61149 RepID=A0A2P2Q349_RHIMU